MAATMSADELEAALDEERARIAALYREIDLRDRQIAKMRYSGSEDAEALRLGAEIRALQASTSWRITAPLRSIKTRFLSWRRGLPRAPMSSATTRPAPGLPELPDPHAGEGRGRRKILVVDVRIPAPDIQSSGVRMTAIVDLLREFGFDVTFISNHGPADYHWVFANVGDQLRERVAKLRGQGVSVIFGYDAAIEHLISKGRCYEAAFVCFPDLMLQYAAAIRVYAPQATLIYDTVDLHGIRHRRAAELSRDAEDFRQADYYDRMEAVNILSADRIVAISAHEARLIANRHPDARVFTIPNIHSAQDRVPGFAERGGLLFIGHYLHAPNQDAAEHLARDIHPMVRAALGDVPLYLVGSSPTEQIKGLAGNGVHVAGHVPNAEEYFDRCRVFAAPLRYGAGMKGKIGQSMSLGLPVVTTSIGAEGMDLENGETALIADNPQDFAAAVIRLYRDEALWRELSRKALDHVGSRFSVSVARTALQELLLA